jgi:hypothetical protein
LNVVRFVVESGPVTHRLVDGIDAYNFPADLTGHPLLAWIGDDYVQYIARELLARFRQQDAHTELLALKCESLPEVSTRLQDGTGTVSGVTMKVPLQLLLQDKNNDCWRLRGVGEFVADQLHLPSAHTVRVGFEIESAEPVGRATT